MNIDTVKIPNFTLEIFYSANKQIYFAVKRNDSIFYPVRSPTADILDKSFPPFWARGEYRTSELTLKRIRWIWNSIELKHGKIKCLHIQDTSIDYPAFYKDL